jgi:cardiolipin synthase
MPCILASLSTFVETFWPHFVALGTFLASLGASAHAVLHKRDTRATIGWVGLIWLAPIIGVVLYFLLGINRIRRRAVLLRSGQLRAEPLPSVHVCTPEEFDKTLGGCTPHLRNLVQLVGRLTARPLLSGNKIEPLHGGDAAFPAMLAAIDGATRSVSMMSYIFDNDRCGRQFAEALARAVKRGVEVRVLIDAIGSRYSFPSIVWVLARAGVRVERFLETFIPWFFAYANLRNHRKILVVDGKIGFTGGLNIREGAMLSLNPRHPLHDLHFRITGPVVLQLQEVFAEDWAFSTNEVLAGDLWYPPLESAGEMLARGIRYGPDEDLGEMRLALAGALSCAERRVGVLTPYFLPDDALISALNVAAMRGVEVDIILPAVNNLRTVQWASTAMLWQVLEYGCRVWLSPPPFDHTKLMLIDDSWTLLGSGNWDPRSLRLNFEFNVECYDRSLAAAAGEIFDRKKAGARQITLADVDGRRLPVRLRDGIARLLSPYL